MDGLLLIAADCGLLIVDNRLSTVDSSKGVPSNGMQLASILFATYQGALMDNSSEGLSWIRMDQVQYVFGKASYSEGAVIVVAVVDHRVSRPITNKIFTDLHEVVGSLAAEKTKSVLQKQLHAQLCSYAESNLKTMVQSLATSLPYFKNRKVIMLLRREAGANDQEEDGIAFGDLDFHLGHVRKATSKKSPPHPGGVRLASKRSRKGQDGGGILGLWGLFGMCASSKPGAKKKSSVHPLPQGEEGKSALHAARSLGRCLDFDSSSAGTEGGGQPGTLARDVLAAVTDYQSVTSDGVEAVRRYRYDLHSKQLTRPRRETGHGTAASLELRAAASASASHATPTPGSRKRSSIVAMLGGLSGKRGTVVAAPTKPAAVAAMEVLYVPELQLLVVCKVENEGLAAPIVNAAPELDVNAAALWDFLLIASSCLQHRLVPGVQDLPLAD